MVKVLLVSLVLLANYFCSIPALPSPLKERSGSVYRDDEYRQGLKRAVTEGLEEDQPIALRRRSPKSSGGKRAPFAFGTALEHGSESSHGDSYLADLWETYNKMYPESRKRGGIKFGTALGHDDDDDDDKYIKDQNDMFDKVFGKRERISSNNDGEGAGLYQELDSTDK